MSIGSATQHPGCGLCQALTREYSVRACHKRSLGVKLITGTLCDACVMAETAAELLVQVAAAAGMCTLNAMQVFVVLAIANRVCLARARERVCGGLILETVSACGHRCDAIGYGRDCHQAHREGGVR